MSDMQDEIYAFIAPDNQQQFWIEAVEELKPMAKVLFNHAKYTRTSIIESERAAMAAEVERLRGALRYLECPPFGDDDPDYGLKTREYAHTALAGGKEG